AALRAMPEIDAAKVAQLREALARGEVRFDAGKLAGLIARYHGVRE
ncbi:MAG TPA: flagellar biosynthesis anti-sigma factor FlgM, partial [Acidovorax sp.]|nr:flagellar biosynthesis anti-sigma factor FlgM [Acidovorax sp.]